MHAKLFLIDFAHVIVPVLRPNPEAIERYFENVFKTIYLMRTRLNQTVNIDLINMDCLFNSFLVHKHVTLAFLRVMVNFEQDSES